VPLPARARCASRPRSPFDAQLPSPTPSPPTGPGPQRRSPLQNSSARPDILPPPSTIPTRPLQLAGMGRDRWRPAERRSGRDHRPPIIVGKELAARAPEESLWQAAARPEGVTSGTFYGRFRRYLRAAGLAPTGIHVLRHTAAKLRCDAGESIEAVSAFLDHSSLARHHDLLGPFGRPGGSSLARGGRRGRGLANEGAPPPERRGGGSGSYERPNATRTRGAMRYHSMTPAIAIVRMWRTGSNRPSWSTARTITMISSTTPSVQAHGRSVQAP